MIGWPAAACSKTGGEVLSGPVFLSLQDLQRAYGRIAGRVAARSHAHGLGMIISIGLLQSVASRFLRVLRFPAAAELAGLSVCSRVSPWAGSACGSSRWRAKRPAVPSAPRVEVRHPGSDGRMPVWASTSVVESAISIVGATPPRWSWRRRLRLTRRLAGAPCFRPARRRDRACVQPVADVAAAGGWRRRHPVHDCLRDGCSEDERC